jgi:TPR repeat protein
MRKTVLILLAVMVATIFAATPEGRRAFRQFEQRAENGDAEAQYRLATVLETGWDSVPADSVRALSLMQRSAQNGFPPAMNYLGYLYGKGYEVGNRELIPVDRDSSLMWLRRSADAGDPRAVSNLAYLLLNDTVSTLSSETRLHTKAQNDSIAFVYLQKGASAQIPTAFSMLGDMYRDGRWVKRDTLKAAANYEAALERGLGDAEARLIALMGHRWQRLPQDSAFNLGLRYYTGYAPGAGVLLLEHASEIPDTTGITDTIGITARAMALLGDAYSRGVGVKYSHDKSLEYFARAALAGNPSAMYILAETLEVFPDALQDLPSDFPDREAAISRLSDPARLRRQASSSGIRTSTDAHRALFAH